MRCIVLFGATPNGEMILLSRDSQREDYQDTLWDASILEVFLPGQGSGQLKCIQTMDC